jgi:dTDP-4-amino-4,6-dideoxygalactose transaminase
VNSRLDSIQAAILDIKLKHLDAYAEKRREAAAHYDKAFAGMDQLVVPVRQHNSTHVFHQYTLKVKDGKRDELQTYLKEKGLPSMIYYPVPLYEQEAYKGLGDRQVDFLPVTDQLCKEVISLAMHSELNQEQLEHITETVKSFWK